jgi:multiple sugar transport system substrate-binding protein
MSCRLRLVKKVDIHSTGRVYKYHYIEIIQIWRIVAVKNYLSKSRLALYLRACALALAAAVSVGCGAPSASQPSASGQPVTLTYAFPNDAASSAAATALIKAYTTARPEVTIEPLPLPAQDYAKLLLTQLDGDPPDMFVNVDAQAPALINRGAVLDLQPLLAEALKLKADDFQPGALAPWQHNGGLYGLPSDLTPAVMFYNRDLFTANGVAEPALNWTWDDWLANAQQLTAKSGDQIIRHGTAVAAWTAMVWGNGGELVSPDGKRLLLDSPEAAAGVQFAADMVNVHRVAHRHRRSPAGRTLSRSLKRSRWR